MTKIHLLALTMVMACASSPRSDRATITPGAGDRNVITEEEIRAVPAGNLYDLVSNVRPNMLRSRGQSTLGGTTASDYPMVYVDGRQYGDISSLRSLIPSQVSMVRYYDATTAAGKFGMTAGSGVIEVTIRK